MENKMKYKLFFSDLDHTLLVNNHIPSFNLEAIEKAKEKGVKFVLCTGRSFNIMNHLLKEIKTEDLENEYTICNSGSTIYENKNQRLLSFKEIDKETIKIVFEYTKKLKDVIIIFDTLDIPFIFNDELVDKKRWENFKYNPLKSLDDIKDSKIIRIILNTKDSNYLKKIQNDINNEKMFEGRISNYTSGPFLELNAYGVCKGEALKWLCNYLKVDIKETIAIGDDYNDESMLKEAGLSCCVKSANDDIKKISKYICEKDYFEGSVKEVIEKFILN
jgi:Cof subfamily protein (haloacid dehalogenase superfamily)